MPKDERLLAPEGVDPLDGGPISKAPSHDSYEVTRGLAPTLSTFSSSGIKVNAAAMEEAGKSYDMNVSRDVTLGTDVNTSHEEYLDEYHEDEEQPPVFEEPKEYFPETGRRKRNKLGYILIAVIVLLVILVVLVSVAFGTNAFKGSDDDNSASAATDGNAAAAEPVVPAVPVDDTVAPVAPPEVTPGGGGEVVTTNAPVAPPGTLAPTPSPTISRASAYTNLIADKSFADPAVFMDDTSPESLAMDWLINEDPLELDPNDLSLRTTLRINQRYGLATIFFNSFDQNWTNETNWLDADECTWFGVSCEGLVVVDVDLRNNGLIGIIPPDIALLQNMRSVNLNDNNLQGGIPTSVGGMPRLSVLGLRNNQLTGELTDFDFTGMNDLGILDLKGNDLGGRIPDSVYSLTDLYYFDVEGNELTGLLPPEIGNLINLDRFVIANNNMDGPIPTQIGQLAVATVFDISGNDFGGTIPTEVGNMVLLEEFRVNKNDIVGAIPTVLGSIGSLGENQGAVLFKLY